MKNPHSTKRGPGRRHKDGHPHGTALKPATGNFSGQHTNPRRNAHRHAIAAVGGPRAAKRMQYRAKGWL